MLDEGSVHYGRKAGRVRDRVFAVALLLNIVSVVGFVLAVIFQWPSDLVHGDEPDS